MLHFVVVIMVNDIGAKGGIQRWALQSESLEASGQPVLQLKRAQSEIQHIRERPLPLSFRNCGVAHRSQKYVLLFNA